MAAPGIALFSLGDFVCIDLIGGGLLVDLGGGTSTVGALRSGADFGVRASSFGGISGGDGDERST
jgi:hypothetical protein